MHFGRSSWAYAKPYILWIDDDFKGWIDFSFLLCYATGIIYAGMLGDKIDIRKLYSFGLFFTAVTYVGIGLLGVFDIQNKWAFIVL